MKKALITGITGQDGSYLAELLLEKGYEVHGIIRRASVSTTARIDHIMDKITIHEGDLSDSSSIIRIVLQVKPDEIYNLAAQSHVQVSFDAAEYTGDVDALGVLRILEAVHIAGLEKTCRIYQASTSELYGKVEECPQSETTPFHPYSPYAVAKQYGFWMIKEYREAYGMQIYCVRPFNHTGIGQRDSFVLPSFCKQAAVIERSGKPGTIKVGNLAAERDFSDVRDIVRAYRMIIENSDCTRIYNVGSGKAYKLSELLNYIVSLSKQKITVEIDPERFRPVDTQVICCNHELISKELGWKPKYSIFDTLKGMFDSYLCNI